MRGMIGGLVDDDIHLLNLLLLLVGHQVNLIRVLHLLGRQFKAFLIDVDKVVGVDGLQLGLRGIADIHLVVALHIGPLCLTVKPDGGIRRGGVEFSTLDSDITARASKLLTDHLEVCLHASGIAHGGSGFVEDALGILGLNPCAHQQQGYHCKILSHILINILVSI